MVWLEALSYIVTILGFPAAIYVFIHEQRNRASNEDKELHRNLSQEYDDFLRLVLENADLLLLRNALPPPALTDEQAERKEVIFRMLVSLFEKAFVILHRKDMDRDAKRRWLSWEDDMREWCRRDDFRAALPHLLEGEDEEFSRQITEIAQEEAAATSASGKKRSPRRSA